MLDFDSLSLAELRQIQKQVEKAISTYEDRARQQARVAAAAVLRKYGLSIESILNEPRKGKTRAPVKVKYANPDNPLETWTGRGLQPRWVVRALASGKTWMT